MVFFSSATSNFKRGGITTRGGGNTEELIDNDAPPTSTNQKAGWWSRAMNWVGNHSEGLGKTIGGVGALGAWVGDTIMAAKGKKPFLQKGLNDLKKQAAAYVDKDEQSGLGKLVKGFSAGVKNEVELKDKVIKDSNGHVPVGYDKTKPYYINPSLGGINHNQFSPQIANEWCKYRMHLFANRPLNPEEQELRKQWKKWKKWRKKQKKGKKGDSSGQKHSKDKEESSGQNRKNK